MNTKLKGMLILTGVFALGAVAGAGGSWAWLQREVADELGGQMDHRFERRHLKALARQLDLSDEQRAKVAEVMASHREERDELMRSLAEDCGGELRQHREKVADEIRGLLDPEQQRRYDDLRKKQLERFPLMGPPRGGRKGGHGPGRQGRGPQGAASAPRDPAHAFGRFDEDGDGKLTEKEVPPRVWPRLQRADGNEDGVITQDEFSDHRAQRRLRRGGRRGGPDRQGAEPADPPPKQ